MSEIKKVNECKEFKDEELKKVAGGYSYEHWKVMTDEERNAARAESDINHMLGKYCAMDDPNA